MATNYGASTTAPTSRLSKMSTGSTINNGTTKASPVYIPRQVPATKSNLERTSDKSSSPQENGDKFNVPLPMANGTNDSNKTLPNDKNTSVKNVEVDNAMSESGESDGSYWSPSMDGIIPKMNENIMHINDVLYGLGQRRKLPVFEELCRE